MGKPSEIGEDTKLTLDLKTIGIVITGAVSLAGLYFTLTAEIELAKELPKPELTRTEYDLKDQLIRETIENTAEQVQENSEKLDKIDEKLYEIIQK
jgi:Mg2+ and Co2+ transporter CorA|tara:strand:+ start:1509 stop:1796 length:288 start_codon:yes stop_codon:yes gene_type:complete